MHKRYLLAAAASLIVAPLLAYGAMTLFAATAPTINWKNDDVQSLTLRSSGALVFKNGTAGGRYTLVLRQDATGGRTVTWPTNVLWPGGNAPILTTAANSIDVTDFLFDGDKYLGSFKLNFLQMPPAPPPPPPAPTLTFTASPTTIQFGALSTLAWTSANATSCAASGGWSGSKALSGTFDVSPSATTTYALDCSGAGGNVHKEATVNVVLPPPLPPSPLLNGLVHYWKLDESSGNATDAVGSLNLTNNNAVFTVGKINNAIDVERDTDNSLLNTSDDLFISTPSAYTVSVWVKNESQPTTDEERYFFSEAELNAQILLKYRDVGGTKQLQWAQFSGSHSSNRLTYDTVLNDGTWNLVTVAWTGTMMHMYLNGTEVASAPYSVFGGDGNNFGFGVGGSYSGGVYPDISGFDGMIDEVGVWNRTFSASEVAQLYNGGTGKQYPF